MSTRELAYKMIDELTDEELNAFITLFCKITGKSEKKKSARGIWHSAANPELIPLEEGAWERAVAERYGVTDENT